jgi:hypothetical protein
MLKNFNLSLKCLHDAHVEVRACAVLLLSSFILNNKENQRVNEEVKRLELFLPLLLFTVVNDASLMVRREVLCALEDYLFKKVEDVNRIVGLSMLLMLEINATPYQVFYLFNSDLYILLFAP